MPHRPDTWTDALFITWDACAAHVIKWGPFVTRDALRGHTVSKNGSISFFFFLFTRDAPRGHTVSKNGSISFFFFFFSSS